MFNKHNTKEDNKILIARINTVSRLVLRYDHGVFIPPHVYNIKSLNKDNNTTYKNTSLHSKPFWEVVKNV